MKKFIFTTLLVSFMCLLMYSQQTFNDVSTQLGITGFNGLGHAVGWSDIDNDGDPDVAVSNQDGNGFWFFRNDISSFENVTSSAGLGGLSGNKIIFAEVTGDTLTDLILKPRSSAQYLFKNNGDGTFTNISALSGITGSVYAVADFNNDGSLDLVSSTGDDIAILYNDGYGSFQAPQVIGELISDMGIVCLDYDDDGLMDIYGTTYGDYPNKLFRNNGDGSFEDKTYQAGVAYSQAGHGLDAGDYNNDGYTDLYVGSYSTLPCKLFKNNGDGTFTNVGPQSGTSGHHDTRTSTFVDYNNDGWLDIFSSHHDFYSYSNTMLRNNGDGTFTEVAVSLNLSGEFIGDYFGVGWADYNNDGAMDLFAAGHIDKYNLFRNQNCPGNYLILKLKGTVSNHTAIGAKIKAWSNGQLIARNLLGSGGVHDFSNTRVHLGLGENTMIDSLQVNWPSGIVQRVDNIQGNQVLIIEEDSTMTGIGRMPGRLNETSLNIYPNPAVNKLTVDSRQQAGKLLIFDIFGRSVLEQKIENHTQSIEVNIADFKAGIYVVILSGDGGITGKGTFLVNP